MLKMKQIKKTKLICNNCEDNMDYVVVDLSFGYGSKFDDEHFEFCSDKCLKDGEKMKNG